MDAEILRIFAHSSDEKHFALNTYSEVPRNKTDLAITSGQNANWTYANFFIQNDYDEIESFKINEGQYVIKKDEGVWRLYDFRKIVRASGLAEIDAFVKKIVAIYTEQQNKLSKLFGTSPQSLFTDNLPLQQIFYGAPGTGKSHEVKIITGELDIDGNEYERPNVFRTTFHPDTDYATFVGCYKPTMATRGRIYTQGELISKLTEIKKSGVTYPVHKFSAKYWDSIEKLSTDEIKNILASCGFTESMNVEVSKGLAVGQEFAQNCDEQKIIYSFVPQAFTDAYVYAYNHPEEPTFLVIEEINRGNCAQIFGDLFQLLDRKEDGTSEYSIKADKDLAKYLLEAKTEKGEEILKNKKGIQDGKLRLPKNLNILATMNTSDQSLFPMDSAFKRRWDWRYVAISYTEDKSATFTINVGKGYQWVDFIRKVNKRIFALTQSEDKELGNFFIKSSIDAEQFKSKVMFYLWYEVLRDEVENSKYFFYYTQKEEGTDKETTQKFTFKDLYGDHADAILEGFLQYISKDAE